MTDRDRGTPFQADCVAGNCPQIVCPPPVAETPESQQVAETCRGERQDGPPPVEPRPGSHWAAAASRQGREDEYIDAMRNRYGGEW